MLNISFSLQTFTVYECGGDELHVIKHSYPFRLPSLPPYLPIIV